MRIVNAEEAVAASARASRSIVHCAAATPSVLLDALVARAAGAPRRRRSSTCTPRDRGRTSRPRWRATSAIGRCSSGRTRGPPSTRAGPTTCRCSCRTCRGCSRPARCRSTRCFVNVTPPDAHGFCSLGTSVEAMHAAIRAAEDGRSSSSTASMPRTLGDSFIHVDDIDLAVEVDVPPYEHASPHDRRRRAADRRARRRARARRRHAPARASARSRPRPRLALARQARPRDPHRDVHRRRSSTWSRPASSPARARSATAARS